MPPNSVAVPDWARAEPLAIRLTSAKRRPTRTKAVRTYLICNLQDAPQGTQDEQGQTTTEPARARWRSFTQTGGEDADRTFRLQELEADYTLFVPDLEQFVPVRVDFSERS